MLRFRGWLLLLLGIALAAPAGASGRGAFDGQYVGELTLIAVIQGDCSTPPLGSLYPLTVADGRVRFLYTPRFSTTLLGTIDRNGVFKAAARTKGGAVQMNGRIQGGKVAATIASPSCNYKFATRP